MRLGVLFTIVCTTMSCTHRRDTAVTQYFWSFVDRCCHIAPLSSKTGEIEGEHDT